MKYPNFIFISQMKDLDLFDNIAYKYIKGIEECPSCETLEIEIEDMDCDRVGWCKTQFTFYVPQYSKEMFDTDTVHFECFKVRKEYNESSPYALMVCGLLEEED
jgi:hypothetical protein